MFLRILNKPLEWGIPQAEESLAGVGAQYDSGFYHSIKADL